MPKNDLIFDVNFEHPTCKGRSKNTSSYFCPYRTSLFLLLITQGAALGYGIHWAFSPFKLNPKLEVIIDAINQLLPVV